MAQPQPEKKFIYVVVSGSHSRYVGGARARFSPGDKIHLTRAQAKAQGPKVRPYVADEDLMEAEEADLVAAPAPKFVDPAPEKLQTEEELWGETLDAKVGDVIDTIEGLDDLSVLHLLTALESAGKGRKMVLSALQARIGVLTEEEG
jgi:hypothetical protein